MAQDYEILGQFYLGRQYNLDKAKPSDSLVLYDAKDLLTHAICVGMTGSGKTGLCLALLEEAAIDGIPAIIIDPKGDLGNLLLTFPKLDPTDFKPWIDNGEATRAGKNIDEYSASVAERWKRGLGEWDQKPDRIQRFRDAVDIAIYTPGSNAGLPLTVLKSFSAPSAAVRDNSDAMRERVMSAVSGLLALLGVEADPLKSREHILLSTLVDRAWREGRDLDLGNLIREIQSPGIDKIGVMDLESFYPEKERFELSMSLNNLLASPGFQSWMQGEPLDIQRLLYTPEGKPRHSILSIAHLSDPERMFFVTILLNEMIAWMRSQSGTTSLRALLYMDEVFGYFPPTANPPSKTPMLTMLKQARAFGLGVVLATQNPVDLDYKGLSNCGTWFLGRLQTERDKMRVLDGLEGASLQVGATLDRATMEKTLSALGNRVFLMNNVHDDHPIVFQSRWALSYLRGPITSDQIRTLMADRKAGGVGSNLVSGAKLSSKSRPILPPGITEAFFAVRNANPRSGTLEYRPALIASGKVHYANSTAGVDYWEDVLLRVDVSGELDDDCWAEAKSLVDDAPDYDTNPADSASYANLPPALTKPKQYDTLATGLKNYLYQRRKLAIWKYAAMKLTSQPNESEAEFRIRLSQAARERRDSEIEKLRAKYAPKLNALLERKRKAEQKVAKEKEQANQQWWQTGISIGTSVLGAVLGRKIGSATNVGRVATSARSASKILREQSDVGMAEDNVEVLDEKIEQLEAEFKAASDKVELTVQPDKLQLDPISIQPKKTDITVNKVTLAWVPWIVQPDGSAKEG